ncbi:MAG: cation-translocating P-type ATPase, partial [Nitrospirae bacterium]|nr:cation-translocating P-type ATPase [Nitrospirota bacterium]
EGDRVAADASIIFCTNLSVDEALLTGESVPVTKTYCDGNLEMARPGGDGLPFVYSGTLVIKGFGVAVVKATGAETEIGKIGKALQTIEPEETPLQKATGILVRNLAGIGLSLCALVVVIYGITRNDWLNGVLAGITLAMAVLPEEIPVILTVFLAIGAWRISRKHVLTRRIPSVETLGASTVLCVDKTGTLTLNRMTVRKIFAQDRLHDIPDMGRTTDMREPLNESLHGIIEFGILASQADPFDPMEKALRELGINALFNTEHIHTNWIMVQEYPLSENLLAMSRVWKSPDNTDYVIACKGAPESIKDICHLDKVRLSKLSGDINLMAKDGLRVIGVAKATFKEGNLPFEQHDFNFEFLGLIGFADPVRKGVAEAIKECHGAGIRVLMITGDYPVTAQKIAEQIGLAPLDSVSSDLSPAPSERIITGQALDKMNDVELRRRIGTVNIFARVVPEQKLHIINALKSNGEIVAMTGDGVNDAAALKSAHIGIAMGGRGTDVAREASDIVLLDDDFSSIVQAVRMGRRIYDNLKKAMAYTIAVHVPIAGLSLFPIIFKWDLILLPVHIVFLELIIDPACSIVFEAEPEETDVMNRPPRKLGEPIFKKRTLIVSLLQGFIVLFIVMAMYGVAKYHDLGEVEARTLAFTTLIVANICLILTNRSWSRTILDSLGVKNTALWWVIGGAALFLGLVLYTPTLRNLFRFGILHGTDLLICLTLGITSILWFEGFKLLAKRRNTSFI